jgi:predicted component of type VI protein secretion system
VWKDPFATLPETRLVVSKGPPGLEPFYRVHKSAFTIGARQGEMDLAVNLPQLSGHHVTVQLFKGGNVFVKDEHSTNGTFVDGRRLNPGERVQVRPGQSIRLSQHLELTLVQPGVQPAEPSAGVPLAAAPPSAPAAAQPSAEAPRTKARTIYAPARGDDE